MYDVVIIGGSYAGIAAALQLVRARRNVLVLDAGVRRNRFAAHAHGFLGQDGVPPDQIWQQAKDQIAAYPTLKWLTHAAVNVTGSKDSFQVTAADGSLHLARRILFATGVIDNLPEIRGLPQRWGRHVFHCPYCHGYELNAGKIACIATGPMSVHQAQILPEWGTVKFFVNGTFQLDEITRQDLKSRMVTVEETQIIEVDGEADIILADTGRMQFSGIFIAPRMSVSSPLPLELGCSAIETPMGEQLQTNETKETNVLGVYACGDIARLPTSISLAVSDGAWAGAQVHRSLIFDKNEQA